MRAWLRTPFLAATSSLAVVVAGVMAVIALPLGGMYLAGVDYLAAWKGAMDACVFTPPGSPNADAIDFEVRSTSSWLPYYDCVTTFKDGTVRHRPLHVWRP